MNLNRYLRFLPMLMLALMLSSCKKYLSIEPKGVHLLKTVDDYNLWLNNFEVTTDLPESVNLLADNIDLMNIELPLEKVDERVFSWQAQFNEDQFAGEAINWKELYRQIYYYNTLINGIDAAADGSAEQKAALKAEALLGRSFSYLYLVNLFAKPFDVSTANNDLSVPLVISHDLNDPTPPRATVKQVYDFIIRDLNAAIPHLPANNNNNRFRGSVAAAYSVLARTYQYMGNHAKAAENAQMALNNGPNTILDFTTMADARGIANLTRRSDVIYTRVSRPTNVEKIPTLEYLKSFNTSDLRLKFYYNNLGDYSFATRGLVKYRPSGVAGGAVATQNWGPTVAEMQLILAESAAWANDLGSALNFLDVLRKKRFPPAGYQKYESANQAEVIQKIMLERSFEFPFNGMRWIDMRRLNVEGKMPEVKRLDKSGNVIATLAPGSPRYTLQIPVQIMQFNPDWQQNP